MEKNVWDAHRFWSGTNIFIKFEKIWRIMQRSACPSMSTIDEISEKISKMVQKDRQASFRIISEIVTLIRILFGTEHVENLCKRCPTTEEKVSIVF